ncbi:MAG: DUF255 domain-containing protein [Bacteroidota bacterium]
MKKLGIILPLLLIVGIVWVSYGFVNHYSFHPGVPGGKVNWVSMEEAVTLAEQDGKKIVVDVYTDWCGWCKVMDRQTYGNQNIADYINENFHAVKFDAEGKESITIGDKTYKFVNQGRRGYHEYAAWLLAGQMSFPSTTFLDSDHSMIGAVPGFIKPTQFSQILEYTHTEAYENMSFQEYVESGSK